MANLCKGSSRPEEGRIAESSTRPWTKTLTCENPVCRETHTYRTADLCLYDE